MPTSVEAESASVDHRLSPRGRARDGRRTETHERLFAVSLREFQRVGVAAAQIEQIAKAAGVPRGTFYFHFPTKDDVLIELAHRINERVAHRLRALGESDPSIRDLLTLIDDAISDEHGRVGEAHLLADMFSLYTRRPLDVLDPIRNVPTLSPVLARYLREAADRAGLGEGLDLEALSVVFIASLFGLYMRIPPGRELRSASEALVDVFVRGLAGGE